MGTARLLTNLDDTSYQVKVSDDGQVIAFRRASGLWAINSDGTKERFLVSADDFKAMKPTDPGVGLSSFDWIPGTHILLFNTILLTNYGISMTDDLHLVNADTKYRIMLLSPGKGGNFLPSPDGKLIAVVSPSEIRLMNIDGSGYHKVITYPSVGIPSEYRYYAQPIWASDSQSLLVAIPPEDVFYKTKSPTIIWHLPIDHSTPTIVSKIAAERGEYVFISPDFSRIAIMRFLKQEVPNDYYELHIAKINGSEDILYYNGTVYFVSWAQDSKHFVCQVNYSYQLGGVGTDFILLAERADRFTWVDTSHYLYTRMENGKAVLRLGFVNEPSVLLVGPKDTYIFYDFLR